ncbi:hypothetical protein C8035_v012291 [Colletotrichum spinosum]|uniref:M6 protein n=1 Tax=Colletotrichum spinosum TaxID=1347390 RepID=A0A4R8Q336_9PEZI|nr:hypothetical protein C8035_v012291 [Colletotrichum spinosum]
MVKLLSFLSALLLTAAVNADKHRLCACIKDQGDPLYWQIDEDASKAVVNGAEGRFVWSDGPWFKDFHDAPYVGSYWHAIDGTVNGATDDGWVGGDEANGLCKGQNAESTCFSPGDLFNWQNCGYNDCFTSKAAKTDGLGNPK